ncbi:uncharacterized protein [Halyomorpha halys]|uniref:uncharacterized protein isoform X2 n=1 Tax=Halyomorpha halys TaxID=286706 RepID=UPI0034D1BD98
MKMKCHKSEQSLSQESRISIESPARFEFPFQLIEQNYQEKIELIKSTLHGIDLIEDNTVEEEEISRRQFNSNFASLQSWFVRISHKEKLSFVLKLLKVFSVVLKRSTNVLLEILGPISKDFVYAKTQFTFSKYDMTPLDHNRCLTDIPLAEAQTNSVTWFSELEEMEQVCVMIILLTLSGSAVTFHFYFKAVKYIDHSPKYNSSVIEEKLNNYKFYSKMMESKELINVLTYDYETEDSFHEISHMSSHMTHSESHTSRMDSHVTAESKSLETKNVGSVIGSVKTMSEMSTSEFYEHKCEEWEREFKELLYTSGIFELQLLPISVNRYIFTFLDQRSKKHLRIINRYWYKSSMIIHKEEITRHWLTQIIKTMDNKLFKYKAKDLYSEVKYAKPKMHDKERPQSAQEHKRKLSSKHRASIPISEEENRPRSATSLINRGQFVPKYSIQMTPATDFLYHDKYPKNPYKGRYIISEIYTRFDHTRCIAATLHWIAMSDKSNISLHNMLTGAPNPCQLTGHTGYVTALCFHPSKSRLFSGSCDTTIKYWDVYSKKNITTFSKHKSLITDISANENFLASVSMDQTLRVFKIETGCMMWKYLFSCNPLTVALSMKLEIYLGLEDGSVFKTDLESRLSSPIEREITFGHVEKITCIVYDQPFVITGGADGFVKAWHFEHFDASAIATFNHNGLYVSAVALSFMKVLTTAIDGILRIWDIYNSRLKRQILVNIAKTPILSMICLEIYDHTKVIINSEDSVKVIEFPLHWINFTRTCLTKDNNKEPKFIRGIKRKSTTTPADVLSPEPHLRMIPKKRFERQCQERLRLGQAALPAVVKPSKGDRITLKEVPIISKALLDDDLLLFPRTIPEGPKVTLPAVKSDIMDSGSKVLMTLWKYLPRSTKEVLPGYNTSKKTI